ncbi:MAG: hypothetical protein JW873_03990, partial [Candidatus Saganbacteria bacterium]|nr:hypothetical protein [Candidatus Saganbacteria bacterium]
IPKDGVLRQFLFSPLFFAAKEKWRKRRRPIQTAEVSRVWAVRAQLLQIDNSKDYYLRKNAKKP